MLVLGLGFIPPPDMSHDVCHMVYVSWWTSCMSHDRSSLPELAHHHRSLWFMIVCMKTNRSDSIRRENKSKCLMWNQFHICQDGRPGAAVVLHFVANGSFQLDERRQEINQLFHPAFLIMSKHQGRRLFELSHLIQTRRISRIRWEATGVTLPPICCHSASEQSVRVRFHPTKF